jgi:hypothetical protein
MPEWGVTLMPGLTKIPANFVTGSELIEVERNGCKIVYKAIPDDRTYEASPAWNNELLKTVVDRVLGRSSS